MTVTNLAGLVRRAAAAHPGSPALLQGEASVSWAELDAQVDAVAGGLLARGLVAGDRVAVHLPNTLEFPACWFGVLRAGLVAVPANPGATAVELEHLLGDCGARAVVTAAATATAVLALPAPPELVVVVGDAPAGATPYADLLAGPVAPQQDAGGGEDLAAVLYTSGTWGRPRGVMLSHRALLASLEQGAHMDPPVVGPGDVVLLVLPLFHVYGLNAALGAVALHGATGVLIERFDPVATLEQVSRHRVTSLVGAPPMFVAWSELDDAGAAFASVRVALSGAAPLPPGARDGMRALTGLAVQEGYGLTETAPTVATTVMSPVPKPGSIGRPVPGVELRLLDERGRPVEDGDPGEIVVRGANLFSGYWPDGRGGPDDDGWFATGDVAVLDADGDLHLVDRRRELVLVSGFNVYPREVEQVLAAHPDVLEVAVLGLPHPDTGEAVTAYVVARPGAALTAGDVIGLAARSLARFKCPTVVHLVAELPRSATGKVSKGRLRELAGR